MKVLRYFLRKNKMNERGQAMILIALAFIGLVGFIGLAIDAGILFAHLGHLRRAVDAAALSAANQIRQTTTIQDIKGSAEQLILLNLPAGSAVDDLDVFVETCDTPDTSIPNCTVGTTNRKLARVQATLVVDLAFLPIVGWGSVPLTAEAISEAASIDLVLVIDNSTSMAYNAACDDHDSDDGDLVDDDCPADPYERWWPNNYGEENPVPCPNHITTNDPFSVCYGEFGEVVDLPDNYLSFPSVCNVFDECHPFEEVREAAKKLVYGMYDGYDQIALVTFNKYAGNITPEGEEGTPDEPDLPLTISKDAAIAAINDMDVYPNLIAGQVCSGWITEAGDPRGCMRTNHAAGLYLASQVIETSGRMESVKVVVLLSDGLTNAAYDMESHAAGVPVGTTEWFCPEDFWRESDGTRVVDGHVAPFCTDGDPETGYNGVTYFGVDGDPDNLTRVYADYLGCLPDDEAGENLCKESGLGVIMFTIGLGDGVTNYTAKGGTVPSQVVGEELLRYIARVGYNGDPELTPIRDCWGASAGDSCENYFHGEPEDLNAIFEEIADRIFTRLTH
jgi:Flp pilus assembly protein TadG